MADLPTTVAPDGTPVAPYLVLPARDEADLIHRALPRGVAILDLGCGAGRVSRALVDLGHHVTAVDQSPEMIRHVVEDAGLRPICADIEGLALGSEFGGVVLASYLVNVADPAKRSSFLAACRRHVAGDGAVVIQRLDPEAYWTAGAESIFGRVCVRIAEVAICGPRLDVRIEYRIGDRVFPQIVAAEILDDADLQHDLDSADLRIDRWIDAQRTWFVARPSALPHAR